jgi:hypothetical protein
MAKSPDCGKIGAVFTIPVFYNIEFSKYQMN